VQLDLSADYLCWDGTEAITLSSVTRTGARQVAVPIAKGRNIRSRERSPSGGVYAGYERNWHLPARLLPEDFVPKIGDVITDGDGVRWTALTADFQRLKCRWQLGTVDLVLANDLQDTIYVERATVTYDGAGAPVKTYPTSGAPLYALAARMQPITQEVADERGERYARGRWEAIVGAQVPLIDVAEDRVRWVDRTGKTVLFDLVGVRNGERVDELPVLDLEERR
jgi:hypothetical protein